MLLAEHSKIRAMKFDFYRSFLQVVQSVEASPSKVATAAMNITRVSFGDLIDLSSVMSLFEMLFKAFLTPFWSSSYCLLISAKLSSAAMVKFLVIYYC